MIESDFKWPQSGEPGRRWKGSCFRDDSSFEWVISVHSEGTRIRLFIQWGSDEAEQGQARWSIDANDVWIAAASIPDGLPAAMTERLLVYWKERVELERATEFERAIEVINREFARMKGQK